MPVQRTGREPENRKPLILIADDVSTNILILENILKTKYKDVATADGGEKALELTRELLPDLILLDVMMPGMNGFDVCRELKKDPETKSIPIIFLTSKTELEDIVEGFEAGAVDYVTKPFQAAELMARVNTQLELKRSKDKIIRMNQDLQKAYTTLEDDLAEAADYVISMLPQPIKKDQLIIPHTDWYFKPCLKLGGDIFGYHWLDDDHFAFYLLDVSGHGVGAALLSVSVKGLLNCDVLFDTDLLDPACVLSKLNETFSHMNSKSLFYTIWYGVYKRSEHKLIFSNAGHPPAVLFTGASADTAETVKLTTPGVLIGGMPEFKYTNREHKLDKFNRLFLFSDGTYEIQLETTKSYWSYNDWVGLLEETSRSFPEGNGDPLELEQLVNHVQDLNMHDNLEDDFSILKIEF